MPSVFEPKKINRTPAPVDLPGDKLAPQADFTRTMKDKGLDNSLAAFLMGARSNIDKGLTTGWAMDAFGSKPNVPDEAMRKIDRAQQELHPYLYGAGQVAGAVGAASDWAFSLADGLGAAKWLGGIGKSAKPLGSVIGPQLEAGALPRLGAKLVNNYPIPAAAAALVAGGAAGSKAAGMAPASTPAAPQPKTDDVTELAKTNPAFAASWAAYQNSLAGKGAQPNAEEMSRPSAVAVRGLYAPDGSLRPDVTPEQEAYTRAWAAHEAKGLAGQTPEGGRDTQMYDPDLFMNSANNPAMLRAAGGRATAVAPPQAVAVMPPQADTTTPQAATVAVPQVAGGTGLVPGALADIMDAYEEQYPNNRGGVLSNADYKARKQKAAQDREDAVNVRIGAQLGITDPALSITLGRSGQFSHGMLDRNITQQQVRTSTRISAKEQAYERQQQAIDLAAAQANALPDSDPTKQEKLARVSKAQELLNTMVLTPSSYFGTATPGDTSN